MIKKSELNALEKRITKLENALDALDMPEHVALVADAIVAMQKKIGVDQSEDPASLDFRVSQIEKAKETTWQQAVTEVNGESHE